MFAYILGTAVTAMVQCSQLVPLDEWCRPKIVAHLTSALDMSLLADRNLSAQTSPTPESKRCVFLYCCQMRLLGVLSFCGS